ncbi:YggS family pyridoxal phosphate-dependent enzyme [Blattabacterium cuenoti]|uniref:YggS family pyridoxal phosphate-dependent enzyme n=1 Tax=Blattabacterium cuenoti TaxID=1653831 RepID=UPI00163CD85F|nr:YggS family pyridoxal phosphate-dependent enzyme [Blattabacterium cuenoti]
MVKIEKNFFNIKNLIPKNIKLLIVSKKQNTYSIKKLYKIGQKDFGENYIQDIVKKYHNLPKDIRWHMIGNIQSNKLKYIIPFIHLIHSVQKLKHIKIINKIGLKYNKIVKCLLQIRISNELNKSGIFYEKHEKIDFLLDFSKKMNNIKILGLMGIASFKEMKIVENEFSCLNNLYNKYKIKYNFNILSMGMSRDFSSAIKYNTNMIRLGSSIFGKKNKIL